MGNYNRHIFVIFVLVGFTSCDLSGKVEMPSTKLTDSEKDLVKKWQFDYILWNGDTITTLTRGGEPYTDPNSPIPDPFIEIEYRYMDYKPDHTYQLRLSSGLEAHLGKGENYQPNFGFWDLKDTLNTHVLIHNKTIGYEVRYLIIELTEERMERQLIGGRVNFLDPTQPNDEWIEVFKPLNE